MDPSIRWDDTGGNETPHHTCSKTKSDKINKKDAMNRVSTESI